MFLSFLLLEAVSIVMLTQTSKTHETYFFSAANQVTGVVNDRYSQFRSYFTLQATNKELAAENSRLRNALGMNFQTPDSTVKQKIDSSFRDSLGQTRKFTYLPARVVGNSYTLPNNYLTIERGSAQGISKGMAVMGPSGIVGVVVETSPDYSKVMSLLHRNSKVSAMLKKNNQTGSIEWDGSDAHFLVLRNVSKSAKVAKGDTVLTSTYSANFPSHLMVGTVAAIQADPSSNFYTLKIKTATNFFTVQWVDVIANKNYGAQTELENSSKNQ